MQLKDPTLLRSQSYVNGQWLDAADGRTTVVNNPASGARLGTVPQLDGAATRRAIDAAAAAFPAWAAQTAKQRAVILRRWFELMMANQADLAQLMTAEQGKPLAEAAGEIAYAAAFVEWFAEEARRVYGEVIPGAPARQAHRRAAPAGGRGRRHHAVEFPRGHDHPQGGAGARRRLHLHRQARRPDAAVGAGDGGTGRARGRAARRVQRHHRQRARDRRGTDRPIRWCASSASRARRKWAAC